MSPGLLEVIRYFLTLGFTGFGGPLAILGYMQRDLIHKRRWMSETEFLQILPLIKSMPGPVAFQMAVFLGRHRAGFWGGLWAGLGLVLPSFFMMLLLAELSLKFSGVSELNLLMSGLQGAAISLIIVALGTIARPHSGHFDFWLWSLVAGVIFYFRAVPEPILILGAGFLSALLGGRKKTSLPSLMFALPMTEDLLRLFWICFKAGAFVFGSGLAIVPFLEGDFVIETEWVSRKEFMNAIAFGQMTPGPVVITVTYLGYKVMGLWGAVMATVAVFLPSFLHMSTWFPRALQSLSKMTWTESFVSGASAALVGAIVVSVFRMVEVWPLISTEWLSCLLGLFLLLFLKVPGWAVMATGALVSSFMIAFI